jgi:hypothetical protein
MRAGPIFVLLLKWLLVPIALLCVGFYFIGPSIGKSDVAQNLANPTSEQSNDDKPKVAHHGEPKVEVVSVERGGSFRSSSNDPSSDYTPRRSRRDELTPIGDEPKPKKRHKKRHRVESDGPPPDIPFDLGPPPSDTGGTPGGPTDGGGPGGPG